MTATGLTVYDWLANTLRYCLYQLTCKISPSQFLISQVQLQILLFSLVSPFDSQKFVNVPLGSPDDSPLEQFWFSGTRREE